MHGLDTINCSLDLREKKGFRYKLLILFFFVLLFFPVRSNGETVDFTATNLGPVDREGECVYEVQTTVNGAVSCPLWYPNGKADLNASGSIVDSETLVDDGNQSGLTYTYSISKMYYVRPGTQLTVTSSDYCCSGLCAVICCLSTDTQVLDLPNECEVPASPDPPELTQNLGAGREGTNPGVECGFSIANFSTGNLYEDYSLSLGFKDLTISYNTLDNYIGPLGKGWTHTFNTKLSNITDTSLILMQGDGRRIKYTSTDGVTYTPEERFGETSFIEKNLDSTFTLREKDGTLYNFNTDGRLISIVDRNGNTSTLNYTGEELLNITDPYSRIINLSYSAGKIVSITDPLSRIYTLSYTGDLLTSITDPEGGISLYSYDSNGRLISKQDPGGGITIYTYDGEGRIISSTDPLGNTKTIEYTGEDSVLITDRNGNTREFLYDMDLNVIKQKTDPEGNTTTYTYDERGNILSITYPDGTDETFTYDSNNNLLTHTDQGGNITTYTYEPDYNQVSSITDPLDRTTTFSYDTKGNLIIITDPLNNSTTFTYDNQGKVTGITNPLGNIISITYDPYGNISTIEDQLADTTTLESDILGNLKKIIDANNNPTTYSYDNLNHLTSVKDALLQTTTYTYNQTCSSCGDKGNNITSITDANGNTTQFEYDIKERLLKEIDPLGNTTIYTYDGEGNLISRKDPNENTITHTYDSLNRLIEKLYSDGTKTTFTYNTMGRILTAENQNIKYTFTYDPLGMVTQVSDSTGKVITYQYDPIGNRTEMTDPEGSTTTYSFDSLNLLTGLLTPDSELITYSYDSLGRRISMSLPNGTEVSYIYDKVGRLMDLINKLNTDSIIKSYSYNYDGMGNRVSRTETRDIYRHERKWKDKKKTTYTYDELNRLIKSVQTKLRGKGKKKRHGKVEEFSYGPVGNRYASFREVYNEVNQLLSDRRYNYEYDNNGNLIKKTGKGETFTFTYDYENRLIKVVSQKKHKTITVTFAYDPFGRRILKTVLKEEPGEVEIRTTYYTYDNEDIIMEENEKGEVTRYIHGPGIDGPISIEQKGNTYYYHVDGLGSITTLTDGEGRVVVEYEYDSFGRVKKHGGRVKQPYTYTGREWDKETGLYYYRARYYDPGTGRFINKDPIGMIGGVNLYAYVGNNPINYIDPSGLFLGSFIGRLIPYVSGATTQEAAVAGRIGDAILGAGITSGYLDFLPPQMGGVVGATQIYGGAQTIGITSFAIESLAGAGATIASAGIATTLGGVFFTALGGWEAGMGINKLYEYISGQSLGVYIYDRLHQPKPCGRKD